MAGARRKKPPVLLKAYKNPEFLASEDARTVRILCEYLEPVQRFRRKGIRNAVIFYGSARLKPLRRGQKGPDWYRLAAEFAEKMARWTVQQHAQGQRFHLCSGGGPGIMQAVHEGGARVDRRLNIGLNISLPFEQHANPYLDPDYTLEFHYFFMRKFWFMNLSCGAVIFPGGFGTLDELFELLTLTQTGKSSPMPIVLFGGEFWRKVLDFQALADAGVISASDLKLFRVMDDVDQACAWLQKSLRPKKN